MIGAFRMFMSGLKSLWDRPCPLHVQMVVKASWTTTHNDRGHISFSFPSLFRSVDIIVLVRVLKGDVVVTLSPSQGLLG